MSSFTAARVVPGGPRGLVVRGAAGDGFDFYVGQPNSGLTIHVPEGFASDGPSMPRWLRRLLPRPLLRWIRRCLLKAALVHDRLRGDLQFNLVDCDANFLIAMEADLPGWPGPLWARVALREIAFLAARSNQGRS